MLQIEFLVFLCTNTLKYCIPYVRLSTEVAFLVLFAPFLSMDMFLFECPKIENKSFPEIISEIFPSTTKGSDAAPHRRRTHVTGLMTNVGINVGYLSTIPQGMVIAIDRILDNTGQGNGIWSDKTLQLYELQQVNSICTETNRWKYMNFSR